jgi:hypothetical protein
MALVTTEVASFENRLVVVSVSWDDASLFVRSVQWQNATGAPYSVTWGTDTIAIPDGNGSRNLPNRKYAVVPGSTPEEGVSWREPVKAGRA